MATLMLRGLKPPPLSECLPPFFLCSLLIEAAFLLPEAGFSKVVRAAVQPVHQRFPARPISLACRPSHGVDVCVMSQRALAPQLHLPLVCGIKSPRTFNLESSCLLPNVCVIELFCRK